MFLSIKMSIPRQKSSQYSRIVTVQWPRFGPYHLARLEAAAGRLQQEGFQLVALEIAGQDATYSWQQIQKDSPFERNTLFPRAKFEAFGRRQLWPAIDSYLDALQPTAVAICGYAGPAAQLLLAWCRLRGRSAILMSESKADDLARRHFWKEWPKQLLVGQYSAALCGGRPQRAYLEQLGMGREGIFLGYDAVDNDYFRQGAAKIRRAMGAAAQARIGRWGLERFAEGMLAAVNYVLKKRN
jgi:hypothetical protein